MPSLISRRRLCGATAPSLGQRFRQLREQLGETQATVADRFGYSVRTIKRWESGSAAVREVWVETLEDDLSRRSSANKGGAPLPEFNFIDLFAGIGGLRRAFEEMDGRCVFTSEWDLQCQKTYRENFTMSHELTGDITKVPSSAIPSHDLLLAGFPCQPFSIAGVSKKNSLGRKHGFECETQGTLFFEVQRIIEHHRPSAFVLENVKNLTTHDSGRTYRTIMRVLEHGEQLGYKVFPKVIDARSWVPQHRERIFIVGFRDPVDFDWDSLEGRSGRAPTLRDILHPEDGSEEGEEPYTDEKGKVNPKYVLSDKLWSYLQAYAAKHRAKGNGFGFGLFGPDDVARTLSARYYKDGSEILIKRRGGNPRRLTPRECSRLMGYEVLGGERMKIVVSDTQAYKQFGNSVVIPVVRAVAKLVRPLISSEHTGQFPLPLHLGR